MNTPLLYVSKQLGHDAIEEERVILDFSKPFRRVSIIPEIETKIGRKMPDLNNDNIHEVTEEIRDICKKFQVRCLEPQTLSRLLDALVGHFIEPEV